MILSRCYYKSSIIFDYKISTLQGRQQNSDTCKQWKDCTHSRNEVDFWGKNLLHYFSQYEGIKKQESYRFLLFYLFSICYVISTKSAVNNLFSLLVFMK